MHIEKSNCTEKRFRNNDCYENLSTPCFLVNTNIIDLLLDEMSTAVHKRWNNAIIGYSFKTNNLPCVISYMKNKGCWAEVVSSDEYNLAKKMGYTNEQIIFNGPVKGKKEFMEAVCGGAIVNIDSKRELNWLQEINDETKRKIHIGIRVNFCLESYCPGESQSGDEDGRFGFSYENGDLKKAIDFLQKNNIKLFGLHLHCSSKTRSLKIYSAIADVALKIIQEYNLILGYIDIGGGFFGGVENRPTFDEYFEHIYKKIKKEPLMKDVNLIVEPGMSLIGASVDYVTSVVDVKSTKNNNFVLVDGSRIHIDPLMKKNSYTFRIVKNNVNDYKNKSVKKQTVCGFTCMEGDRFFSLITEPLKENDIIIFKKVGAYTIGLAPQFINAHPNVYINNGKERLLSQAKKELPTNIDTNKRG